MKKEYIAFLSAAILIIYGLLTQKFLFVGLGITFILIGIAEILRNKNH
ncbi:MAG: hypothetical protein SOZ69_05175 [Streptococcus sp.]|uniref:Lipoprotein n=1 Tax=Streptococcus porcorum TaxID=701526 RepID=A0ABV2JGP5_9STRE|nr:hypothetical protein [Streptococcus sp.]